MAIAGPSGSGKTYSALLIASGLAPNGKIAVIDTENKSACLYAGMPGIPAFDVDEIDPPYLTEKYLASIKAAIDGGYDVLVIDSISHQWAGEGGLLQKKEQLDARGGNSYANWAKMTPEHEKFKSTLLHSNIHIISTLRSKQDYVLVGDDKGKTKVQKMGMAPVQRDGLEYEFTTVLDMDMAHQASASKDRTGLFDHNLFIPSLETGKQIATWLSGMPPAAPEPKQDIYDSSNEDHQKRMAVFLEKHNIPSDEWDQISDALHGSVKKEWPLIITKTRERIKANREVPFAPTPTRKLHDAIAQN
jgi:hypothetical protein